MSLEEDLNALCGSTKLERDRAEGRFRTSAPSFTAAELSSIRDWVSELLSRSGPPWEELFGALTAARIVLTAQSEPAAFDPPCLTEGVLRCLDHGEFRVRIAAGECLGALCRVGGLPVFRQHIGLVKAGIRDHLERQLEDPEMQQEVQRLERLNSEEVFHDTAGWKSLETWMKCLQCMVQGLPRVDLQLYEDLDFFSLLFEALRHTNRFVRETGYGLLGAAAEATQGRVHTLEVARQLHDGLSDNWSQVRMAASVSTRQFLTAYGIIEADNCTCAEEWGQIWDLLLPPMCLNRYYIAEGVRLYSHETWRLATNGQGKELVATHLEATVAFYLTQADADNHAVREAACSCIAELATKVDRSAVEPKVGQLLSALLVCFKDDSWPVRDAACLACGHFVAAFPGECEPALPDLLELFLANLKDGVPSVRSGAAGALRAVVEAYAERPEARERVQAAVLDQLQPGLEAVKSQQDLPMEHSSIDINRPAIFGVVPAAGADIDSRFENQTMYSCGSLAPKMRKGNAKKGGCHDGTFTRPAQPWEVTDGFVHLLAELSSLPAQQQTVQALLPALAEAAQCRHFAQHVYLLHSILTVLPVLARGLGTRAFKADLEIFLEPLAYGAESEHALTAAAAAEAVRRLGGQLGPNILRGRIEMADPNLLPKLEPFLM